MEHGTAHSLKRTLLIIMLVLVMTAAAACQSGTQTSETQAATTSTASSGSTAEPGATQEASYFNATGYPICDETITVTMSGAQGNVVDWNATVLVKEIEKRMGIKLDCYPYPNDVWSTQFALMISSDTLPDILLRLGSLTTTEVDEYGSQGYFLALNNYIDEYAPTLRTFMDNVDMLETYMTSADGNIYRIIEMMENPISRTTKVYMNKVWLENVNMEAPTTIDELYNVLKAFKEQDANGNGDPNDEIPMSCLMDGDAGYFLESPLLAAFGVYTCWEVEYLPQVDESGTVFLGDTTDNYKAYLKWMNKCYEEGLLDNECFIQTYEEFMAKGDADRVGYFGYWAPFVLGTHDISYDLNFIWCGAFTSEWNDTPTIVQEQLVVTKTRMAVSSKTQYPEAIVRLIDYFYTDEGRVAAEAGYEGVSYDIVETTVEGTDIVLTSKDMYDLEQYQAQEDYKDLTEKPTVVITTGFNFIYSGYELLFEMPKELMFNEQVVNAFVGFTVELVYYGLRDERNTIIEEFPALIYTEEESAARNNLFTDIQLYLQTSKAQFITGEVDIDDGWANYLSTLNAMGLDELLAIDQAAYDRLMSPAN